LSKQDTTAIPKIIIYTDGACLGNPGRGGYAAVLMSGNRRKEIFDGFRLTTNNRMEIMAVVEALKAVNKNKRYDITIYTDSRLVVNAINNFWLKSWIKNGWKKSDRKPVLNQDLWQKLADEIKHHNVKFEWVKAHVGIKENERCDELGKEAAMADNLKDDIEYLINKDTAE
jgi:ribonuclease HI